MTEQVKRYEFFSYIDDDVAELDCHEADDGTWINAADYARLEQECERLREALKAVMTMDVKGHHLQDRLQFSAEGRSLLNKAHAAMQAKP